jgi:thiamine-monophosphate kinase
LRPALDYALSGGEDYELLFTVPPRKLGTLRRLGIPAIEIGRIRKGRTLSLLSSFGESGRLVPTGYDHFRQRKPAKGSRR